jgi:hypothetical protein
MDERAVPKVLHQIWLQGADAMCPEAARWTMQARRVCQTFGWTYRLWSDMDLWEAFSAYREHRGLANTFAHMSDLGRYCILYAEGGLYVDVDTEMVRLPPEGLQGAWIMDGNNAAMAAPPKHGYIGRVLARAVKPEAYDGVAPQVNLCMAELGKDVQIWEPRRWHGAWQWRYGNHLMSHMTWGSNLHLGDTFPLGAKL